MLTTVLSCAIAASVAGAAPAPPEPEFCSRFATARDAFPVFPVERVVIPLLDAADTDILHYALDIEVDVPQQWIGGSNTMTVRSTVDGLSAFHFRVADTFNVTAVEVDGSAAAWNRLDQANVEVALDPGYDTDDVFEVRVAYDGYPQGGYFGSIEFRTRAGGHPEAWTLSEPWFSYTWWPSKDDNTDKSTADLWFTVDDALVVASNGLLQGVDDLGGKRRYRWKTGYPTADYLYCFAVTDFVVDNLVWNHDGGSMPLDLYVYPEEWGNHGTWYKNLDMLDVFGALYGTYPFADEKYGMCQCGFGGGMEHQTMTSQGGFWESTTAHELAHSWWGDMITCAGWHDIWLNEGFATWSEAVWYAGRPGGTMQDYHDRMDYRRPSFVGDSVYVYDISDPGRIFDGNLTYRKGAWVVHMLRHVLGDDVFFDVLAEYRSAYAYKSAVTDDLLVVAENVSGRGLDWFFDTWVYGIGAPRYASAWRHHEAAGRHWVEVYVRQVQDASYPVFPMPIDVALDGGFGRTVAVAWNDARAEHLLVEAPGVVTSVALDPDDWILHEANGPMAFVEGPPKVVATTPAPGANVEMGEAFTVTVTFHEDVVATPAHFALAGDVAGSIAFDFVYDAGTTTATLAPLAPPPPDRYTLTVSDGVVDVAAGIALDGEVSDPADPAALPSGDGLAGGAATVRFEIVSGAIPGDANGDGVVDFGDILAILAAWGPCGQCPEDVNGDGAVNFADLLVVLGNWS